MADDFDSCAIQILNPEEEQDVGDAKGFGLASLILGELEKEPITGVAEMPVEKDAAEYNMFHKHRGKAVIFNQKTFQIDGLNTRNGTDEDRNNLAQTLMNLDFEVEIYDDLNNTKLMRKLQQLSAEDHSDRDCLLVAVFSHGIPNKIYTCDGKYSQNELWDPFTAERCPTLAGKPKIFLIQACQGDQLDGGTVMQKRFMGLSSSLGEFTESDSAPVNETYTIPNRADFLMVFSTVPGYYSWRNQTQGSWFIQSVCKIFNKQGQHKELQSMMTAVSRNVALNFESYVPFSKMDNKKQIPYVTSTLIREVYFSPKSLTGDCLGRIVRAPNMTPETGGFGAFSSLVRPTTKPPTKLSIGSASSSLDMEEPRVPPIKPPRISSPSTNRQTLVNPFDSKQDKTGK